MRRCSGAVSVSGGDVAVEACSFTHNRANMLKTGDALTASAGGGALHFAGGRLTLRGSRYADNAVGSGSLGGAVFVKAALAADIADCVFERNAGA